MRVKTAVQGELAADRRKTVGIWLLLLAMAAMLVASPVEAAKKVKVKMVADAVAELNPDYKGRPSPVNIIVFELTSSDGFANADFFSLFEADAPILGGDKLGSTKMLLKPGESREWVAEFDKETRYVGVIAAYRDIENAQWRGLIEMPKRGLVTRFFKKNKLRITVDSLAVTISTK